eukprot:COSAG05_NODE_5573_length_1137_cov_1.246628_2_plen_40_part_01
MGGGVVALDAVTRRPCRDSLLHGYSGSGGGGRCGIASSNG